jgi:hypothetical protein
VGVVVSGRGEGGWQVNLTWPDVLYPLLYAPSFFTNLPSMFAVKKYGDVLDKMAQGKRVCVWEGEGEEGREGGRGRGREEGRERCLSVFVRDCFTLLRLPFFLLVNLS